MKYVIDISKSDKKIIDRIKDNSFIPTPSVDAILNAVRSSTPLFKGHWIDHSDEGYVECPKCGSATNCDDNINDLHFCFSCGAEMEGSEEE